jgi:hypothetical protein
MDSAGGGVGSQVSYSAALHEQRRGFAPLRGLQILARPAGFARRIDVTSDNS